MAVYTEIHIRRDSTLNWYASNPRLALGEPGVDMDLHRFKIGNGIDRWNELPYMDDDLYKLLNKQEQETADKVQDLLNLIAANKLDADTKHNTVTTELRNTSRELNTRMTDVEEEQTEYEELLTERQNEYEATVSQRQEKYETDLTERQEKYEYDLTAEFEDTRSAVEAGLEEFNETRDRLDTRMDVIVGQATEDTEILDARVDAEYQTHPNLGANIRNIHSQLLSAQEKEAQDKASTNEELALLHKTDKGHDERLTELANRSEKLITRDDHLQEQADTLAGGLLNIEAFLVQKVREVSDNLASIDEKHSEHEEQIADELHEVTSHTRELSTARDDHLQEQADTLAGELLNEIYARRGDTQNVSEALAHEAEQRVLADEKLQENIDTGLDVARKNLSARDEHLQEQTDELSGVLIREALGRHEDKQALRLQIADTTRELTGILQHEAVVRKEEDIHLQEQADQNAQANVEHILTLAHEAEKRRELADVVANIKSPVDWSNAESLAIPEPRCAVVNFTGLTSMPTSKTVDIPAFMEFWDRQGNYFKKPIMCSAQGSSSLGFVKKNVKFDLLDDNGSEFDLKIGNWVVQDGFHLKAYYTDFFRGVGVTSYKLWDEIMEVKPYKRALVDVEGMNSTATGAGNVSDLSLQIDTGALCHPDGFPCIVYLNGTFYGVFSWQLKKQRKNYHLDKGTVEHIHLDGTLSTASFWNGAINWTAFEIRNPNKLYTMDGKKYDGDAPKELIDETSEKYDAGNKDHVRSAKVKKYIQDFVQSFGELKTLYSAYQANSTDETLAAVKAKYEELFDWENQRDYLIFSDVVSNRDGFAKNWQWTTYDGVKWFVNAYDLDMTFGGMFTGGYLTAPYTTHIVSGVSLPTAYIPLLYKSELETRYRVLREAGIIDVEHIVSKLAEWTARIGQANYSLEYERWPNTPCLLNYNDSVDRVRKWLTVEIANMDKVYHYEAVTLESVAQEIRTKHDTDIKRLEGSGRTLANVRYDNDVGLQEQIDQLSELILRLIFADYQTQGKLDARLKIIEEALVDAGFLDESDIPPATEIEITNMLDAIFSGNAPDEDIDDDEEFNEMLDEVFNS